MTRSDLVELGIPLRSETWRVARRVPNASLRALLLNIEGGDSPSLHEAIGIECVAGSLMRSDADCEVVVGDTQFELIETGGKLDVGRLAEEVVCYAKASPAPLLIGIGVPIYGWTATAELIATVEERLASVPTAPARHWVLGNAIATHSPSAPLRSGLPVPVTIVRGDGETAVVTLAATIRRGGALPGHLDAPLFPRDEYQPPPRLFTSAVMSLGGAPKLEMSRGCSFGRCTFCSRCVADDYRAFPAEVVMEQLRELADLGAHYIELADEEAFADIAETARVVAELSRWKHPISFMASTRASVLLALADSGLLQRLVACGLSKVFIGAEGGSDGYLRQMAKGQTVAEIEAAGSVVEQLEVDFEFGFITFGWRMTRTMLTENVEFLRRHHRRVSWLFNILEVRGGTRDQELLYGWVARGRLGDYDPDANYELNSSTYRDVPFVDPAVAEAAKWAQDFADDLTPHYAVKSAVRAASLPHHLRARIVPSFEALQHTHFLALDAIVNGNPADDLHAIRRERTEVYRQLLAALHSTAEPGLAAMVRTHIEDYLHTHDVRPYAGAGVPPAAG